MGNMVTLVNGTQTNIILDDSEDEFEGGIIVNGEMYTKAGKLDSLSVIETPECITFRHDRVMDVYYETKGGRRIKIFSTEMALALEEKEQLEENADKYRGSIQEI